ncbi:MAG: hypothetical protein K2X57_10450 [Xanthobacteraceae bacterium]|nr:hypothetical protein [Xanthobacteraceae bacterium]
MTGKDIENRIAQMPCWPKERQQEASRYRLTDSQIRELVRIQRDIWNGKGTFATDEEMMNLWKSCGL